MPEQSRLPIWVVRSDGRQVPFDGDAIFRALFRAADDLGNPDPFLARELADAVLHFLAERSSSPSISTADIDESIVTVVRELGQPALADTFSRQHQVQTSAPVAPGCPESPLEPRADPVARSLAAARRVFAAFSRRHVYPPALVAAERCGLLRLYDHHAPFELAGLVVEPRPAGRSGGLVEALESARKSVGQFVALDGPEYLFKAASAEMAADWVRDLRIGLRLTGLSAVLNLNCAVPPSWAADASGPLFHTGNVAAENSSPADAAELLLDHTLDSGPLDQVRIDWHLGETDFRPDRRSRVLRVARRVVEGAPLVFVVDRAKAPVRLAEGLDRQHSAVLSVVGMSVSGLAAHLRRTGDGAIELPTFLSKLRSHVSLALSAGQARLGFLRRSAGPPIANGFLLDRARMLIAPTGLAKAVQAVLGYSTEPAEPIRQMVRVIAGALSTDPVHRLTAVVDDLPHGAGRPADAADADDAIGPSDDPRAQLRLASAGQTEFSTGAATVRLTPDRGLTAEEMADLIGYAWRQPGLQRFRFARATPVAKPLSVG